MVRQNEHGLWEVFFNGEMVARVSTERTAIAIYAGYEFKALEEIDHLRELHKKP
ncbi:MAG: hypothetical protein GY928_08900 [Colwellia sp.]|nr:hypothetical protein [Colwellia sp.]